MSIPNTYDPELVRHFVDEIDKHQQEINDRVMEHASWVKGRKEMIARVKKAAKQAGIPKAVLNGYLDVRLKKRKYEEALEAIEPEDRAGVLMVADACQFDFETLPLGEWGGEQSDTSALDEMADDGNPST